jgi:hypothetical protein
MWTTSAFWSASTSMSGSPTTSTVRVADDTRIRAALPTLEELRSRGARLVQLIGAPVTLAPAVVGAQVVELTERLKPGEVLMLENDEPGETKNDPELASQLADLADVYVNDAFGTAHRAHASTEGVAHLLPSAAGRLMRWRRDRRRDPLDAVAAGELAHNQVIRHALTLRGCATGGHGLRRRRALGLRAPRGRHCPGG